MFCPLHITWERAVNRHKTQLNDALMESYSGCNSRANELRLSTILAWWRYFFVCPISNRKTLLGVHSPDRLGMSFHSCRLDLPVCLP